MLLGRRSECESIEALLDAVRAGDSRTLVVVGDPGVGKTALLEYAIESAPDLQIARAVGVESEMELAFAALHQLCAPMLDRLERLPDAQRDALCTAFGLSTGAAPDRFLVGLAALGLMSEAADERPLLCVVDDSQWLDRASAQTLVFLARRLLAEPIGVLFASREPSEELRDLPELRVRGLREADARRLLASAITGALDERIRDRIVAETGGNPLALLELPQGMAATELAGGFGLPGALSGRIEESFQRRLEALPADTQQLLLLAAAEPLGDPILLWRAAERVGIGIEASGFATATGVLELGTGVRFRHPLVRSAVYRAASEDDRRRAHAALAAATHPEADPDRRAWHRAQAAPGPDEDVAQELERSAGRAQARGGLAAAAAFLERAAALTPAPASRARRATAAAKAKVDAGAPEAALRLLSAAEAEPLDELQRARALLVRGQIGFASNRGNDAAPLLLQAARMLEPLDVALARATYLDALSAATFAGRLATGPGLLEVAAAARTAPPPAVPRASDLLLDGLALLLTEGYAAGAPTLKRALWAFRGPDISREEELRWLWLAGHAALDLWDDEAWEALSARHLQLARDAGALAVLPIALNTRAGVHLSAGEFGQAHSLIEEVRAVTEATGGRRAPYVALAVAAFEGREAEVAELREVSREDVMARGEGIGLTIAEWASAVLYNSLGRYDDAVTAAGQASAHPEELRFSSRALIELVEGASRCGRTEQARAALALLAESTQASGSDFGLGTEARSRALLSDGQAAERLYREAIERLARTHVSTALARCHLLYGEWLRAEGRLAEARDQLRTAYELCTSMGLEAFAARAAAELAAAGETIPTRPADAGERLTAREAQVAQLARDGLSNQEIGARLLISPRTVEYLLGRIAATVPGVKAERNALGHQCQRP